MTSYVAEMNAAWHVFVASGGPAPAPAGRVRATGRRRAVPPRAPGRPRRPGRARARPAAVLRHVVLRPARHRTAARFVGVDQLVHGSDRPVGRRAAGVVGRRCVRARPCASQPRAAGWERRHDRPPGGPRPHPARAAHGRRAARPAPEGWHRHVRHDPTRRHYEELVRDAHLSVWLINWTDAQDTGFHDHDVSSGAVAVVQGAWSRSACAWAPRQPGRVRPRPAPSTSRRRRSTGSCTSGRSRR